MTATFKHSENRPQHRLSVQISAIFLNLWFCKVWHTSNKACKGFCRKLSRQPVFRASSSPMYAPTSSTTSCDVCAIPSWIDLFPDAHKNHIAHYYPTDLIRGF
ncbi:polyprotein [Gossypium arboreum]|uniref:Polyprotein n=1 Tax=Gossypium arboreum TaxID=29729 RepID=A0A0B0NLM0_GOSAR|nr:polyprotein [Gossypium arboreum]